MKKIIPIIGLLVCIGIQAKSQAIFKITYNMAAPTMDYIGQFSMRGLGLDYEGFVSSNVSVGGSFGWQTFYESTGIQSITDGTVTATGKQYRYVNALPFLATIHYYSGEENDTRLYAGGGVGITNVIQRTDLGMYTVKDNVWTFGFAPEVGILIPVGYSSSLDIALQYQYALGSGNVDDTSYLAIKVGFALTR